MNVAGYKKTHPITLDKLCNDKNRYVRDKAIQNPNTHAKTLEKITAQLYNGSAKVFLAIHPNFYGV